MPEWVIYTICFVAVMIIHRIAFHIYLRINTCGTLKIDRSNPERDLYRIEIDDLETLAKQKRIILKIDNDAHLSQK